MNAHTRENGVLHIGGQSAHALAERFETPLFVYSRTLIETRWREFASALASHPHLICYAVKANSNLAVLDILARLGSGFDIVSGGELKRVLAAGGRPDRIVFSGVGKSAEELEHALGVGIRCFNVESAEELARLNGIARSLNMQAPVSLRINPDVDARTHPYISTGLRENKFGIGVDTAQAVYREAAGMDHIDVQGIDFHIGSQLASIEPYREALRHLVQLVDQLADEDIRLRHIDVGGGHGIRYADETPIDINAWATAVLEELGGRDLELLVEPGRYVVGESGVLLTRIEYLKSNGDKHFAVVDAAMNDLLRPALYGAWQNIETVGPSEAQPRHYDVVGPVCESADFLGKSRELAISAGDLLCIFDTGAYAAVMSSNYNTRPRAAEVIVADGEAYLVRAREEVEALFDHEYLLP